VLSFPYDRGTKLKKKINWQIYSTRESVHERLVEKNNIKIFTIIYSVIKKDGLSHQFEQIFAQIDDSNDKCSSSLEGEC